MDLGLRGRTGLVAAGAKGLGYGVARALAIERSRISICDIHGATEAAQRLADETGTEVLGTICDVTDPAAIQQWVEQTVAQWGAIDMLLANAGGPPSGAFAEITDRQWQAAFELTLLSTVRMIRAALPHMGSGAAILTSTSSSVIEPIPRLGLSTVMRCGVAGLVKTLAEELAPDGIRINNLIPGRFDTERVRQLDRGVAERLGVSEEEVRARSIARIPLGRLGTAEEYGTAAAFLLSPAASYITGASLRVDGGMIRAI